MSFLCKSIAKLETIGLSIEEQRSIINEALDRLEYPFKDKLQDLLKNNPSYTEIFQADSFADSSNMRFTPLVSVDVQRSFSAIKLIDTARRQSKTEETIKHHAILYLNAKIRDESTLLESPEEIN